MALTQNGRLEQLKSEAGLSPIKATLLNADGRKRLPPGSCFLRARVKQALKGYGSLADEEKRVIEKAAMAESSGATGGYTVPTEYSNVLFQTIAENSIFWPRANIVPMGSVETVLPVPDFSTAQAAGTTAMFGGLLYQFGQGAAGNEGTAITETEPAFRQLSLHAWDLIGQAVASVQWVEDLMAREDGEERLLNLFGQAAAYYADYYFFNGTGAARKTPLGVLNAPCKIAVARSGAGHVTAADVAGMAKRLLPGCWRTAIWCVSPYTLIDLFQITAFQPNQNTVGMPSGCCGSLYSRPVFVTEKLPTLGTTGDIVLMDPALYVIGDRQQPEVAASKDEPSTFVYNQMMFRTWMRCDGKPLLPAAVTLMDGSSTASSVVVLAT